MSVTIKSEHELEKMREAGRILGIVHDEMAKIIRPGISTMDINRKGEEVIRSFVAPILFELQRISGEYLRTCE